MLSGPACVLLILLPSQKAYEAQLVHGKITFGGLLSRAVRILAAGDLERGSLDASIAWGCVQGKNS